MGGKRLGPTCGAHTLRRRIDAGATFAPCRERVNQQKVEGPLGGLAGPMVAHPRFRYGLTPALAALVALAGCVDSSGPDESPTQGDEIDAPAQPADPETPASAPQADLATARVIVNVTSTFSGVYPVLMTYEPAQIEVDHGVRVRLTFDNADHNPLGKHTWKLKDVSNRTREIPVGESDTIEFDAPAPGTYTYVCDVPQHEGFGMRGDFVVR